AAGAAGSDAAADGEHLFQDRKEVLLLLALLRREMLEQQRRNAGRFGEELRRAPEVGLRLLRVAFVACLLHQGESLPPAERPLALGGIAPVLQEAGQAPCRARQAGCKVRERTAVGME